MNFFEKNIEVLKRKRDYLYNSMKEHDVFQDEYDSELVHSVPAKNGENIITYHFGEEVVRLNSLYNPSSESNTWVEQFNTLNLDIVAIMYGFGNAIFASKLLNQLKNKDMLLIYEPSVDIFLHTLYNYDITEILMNENVSITVEGINPLEFDIVTNNIIDWNNLGSMINAVHPQYDRLFSESYHAYKKVLQDISIRAIVNKNTEAFWGSIMAKNQISNLKYIKDGLILEDLFGKISENIPAVIVSAGPSLDKNIHVLKKLKNKAVIFAVDTALRYLLNHDIIPDVVVTIDANKSLFHFQDERFSEIPLFCKYTSNPKVLDIHKGKKIFFYNDIVTSNIYEKLGKEQIYNQIGGSVSTAAFSICIGLDFKRIVLVGQDLCFDGGFTHAGSVVKNPYGADKSTHLVIKNIDGEDVNTRYDWYTYLLWFQDAIKILPFTEVIDATEGGAYIEGSTIMTLEEVIENYCTEEIKLESILNEILPIMDESNYSIVKDELKQYELDLIKIQEYSSKLIEYCGKLSDSAKRNSLDSYSSKEMLKKLASYNEIMSEMPVNFLVNDYIASESTKQLGDINQMTTSIVNNQVNVYKRSQNIYRSMVEAVDVLSPLLKESITIINK